jgi:hypothetical protein
MRRLLLRLTIIGCGVLQGSIADPIAAEAVGGG